MPSKSRPSSVSCGAPQTHVTWITAKRDSIAAGYGLMSWPGTHRLRLVIQRVEEGYPPRSTYRLLAYPAPLRLVFSAGKIPIA
jgi:hypothetical protein